MKYKKFLIASTVFLLLGGVYLYFSKNLNSTDVVPIAFGSSLVSSNQVAASSTLASLGQQIANDVSFLATLVSIKNINIDTTLFTNKNFTDLQNNAVKIEPVVAGRENPFAPIGTDSTSYVSSSPVVITDQPTGLTETSVELNGTVNTTTNVTEARFEYGQIETNLDLKTTIVKQSLVGTFIKNVSGLTPKTNYFYKACAKINNTKLCGEVVSFTTN